MRVCRSDGAELDPDKVSMPSERLGLTAYEVEWDMLNRLLPDNDRS